MQTSYDLLPDELQLGTLVYTDSDSNVRSFASEEEVVVGRLVIRGASDDTCKRLNTGLASKQIGIALESIERPIDGDTTLDNAYPAKYLVSVVDDTNGVAVLVDSNVSPADTVYARICDTRAVQTITFNADFVASNSIAWTLNGVAQTPIVYATSHAATLAALAAAIEAAQEVYTCTGATRTLTITSESADQPTLTFTVTLGASQAVAGSPTVTVAGVAGDQGVFRSDADSGKAVAVSGAKFLSTASAGDLVKLQYRR